jgi:dephospho-CoA kinase
MIMSPSLQPCPTALQPLRWKHGGIPVIGLIGAIGSGKSHVARLLARRGAVVIDADRIGHEVLQEPEVRRGVVQRFGPGVEDRSARAAPGEAPINRRSLGTIVFADPAALRDLEGLLHPRMERRFHLEILRAEKDGAAPAIVLDAAILLERGWDRFCDVVVFVDASWPVRLHRVAASRGWDAATLQAREAAQWPIDVKRGRADFVIGNDGSLDALERAAAGLLDWLARARPGTFAHSISGNERIGPPPAAAAADQAPESCESAPAGQAHRL